ncbi:MAG: hypothetical protein ABI697_11265 [Devosia sp.]
MRFLHRDFGPVRAYLERLAPPILMLDWDREPVTGGFAMLPSTLRRRAANVALPVGIDRVAWFADRGDGPSHAIEVLRYYFHVNSTAIGRPLSLPEAVEHIETVAADNEFILAGHPDGGLVSVSRVELSFQAGLKPITWWGP